MNTEDYREFVRSYLEVTQDSVTEDDIDYYVWLYDEVTDDGTRI